LEAVSGSTQYSLAFDDAGNRFGGNNSSPVWHYIIEDYVLKRNPNVVPPPVKREISVAPGAAPVFPLSKTITRFNDYDRANRFTSACGIEIYRDNLLGDEYYGNSFVCEPVHNLVHRELVTPDGLSFKSRRADDEQASEFLASTDNWFRPTMARTGPDGALYIADMYRLVIEHPTWIPVDWQKKLDLRAGADKGRIYRVVPADKPLRATPRLDKLEPKDLVAALDSPNGTRRDLVQQMIVWKRGAEFVAPLRKLAANSKVLACARICGYGWGCNVSQGSFPE
jgi:putative membrane-bound dehydrogenase-like protein